MFYAKVSFSTYTQPAKNGIIFVSFWLGISEKISGLIFSARNFYKQEFMIRILFLSTFVVLLATSCGSSAATTSGNNSLREDLQTKNRFAIPLLDQISQLPGVVIRNGVPVLVKSSAAIRNAPTREPLYVLDGYIVGSSFREVDQLVQNIQVAEIEILSGPEASFYGSRGGRGVIRITTIK